MRWPPGRHAPGFLKSLVYGCMCVCIDSIRPMDWKLISATVTIHVSRPVMACGFGENEENAIYYARGK